MYPQPLSRSVLVFFSVTSIALLSACGGGGLKPPAPKTLSHILVTPGGPAIGKSKTLQLSATGSYSDGTAQDLTKVASWATSQVSVAMVNATGAVTGMAAGTAQISASYQGISGSDTVNIQAATLVSIAIIPGNVAIGKSKTLQLIATGTYSDGTQQDVTATATWTTSQPTIASVNSGGMVAGLTAGSAQIFAAYEGVTGTDAVTVQPATLVSIAVSPIGPAIHKSKSVQLGAQGTYSDGTQQDVTAVAAWGTSQPLIAAISSSGVVTGMAAGTAQISAFYQGVTGTDAVTIQPPVLNSISIAPSNLSLGANKTFQLTAMGAFGDGTQQDLTSVVNWTTNLPNIAMVVPGGMLTGVAAGGAQISASYQGVTGVDPVTVLAPVVVSVSVSPMKSLLLVGENEQLVAIAAYNDSSTQDVSQSATWSSSAGGVVSVGANGATLAKTAGNVTIRAEFGSFSGSAKVAVTSATAVGLTIVPGKTTLGVGTGKQLSAIATLSDGTKMDLSDWVTWNTTQANTVSVDSDGQAGALRLGSADITAAAAGVSATANIVVVPDATVNYFDLSGTAVSGSANTVRLTNPGTTGENLCAMIYVFDQNQELTECCGCTITDSGLRTLSLSTDLTSNPLTGTPPPNGAVKVVASDPTNNPQCDPRSLTPAGRILGWGTNSQLFPDGTTQVTETTLELSLLSRPAISDLANLCTAVQRLGSGKGVCTCGTGD
jgi:trimeric autotransporter adhesin